MRVDGLVEAEISLVIRQETHRNFPYGARKRDLERLELRLPRHEHDITDPVFEQLKNPDELLISKRHPTTLSHGGNRMDRRW